MGTLIRALTAISLLLTVACTTSQTVEPPLSGPSEFALSLRMSATPDSLSQDGASQSSIQVQAFGPNGRALSGVALRVDMGVNGTLQDYGALSARTIVTGTDGRATTVYTAPPPPPAAAGGGSTVVTIIATPTGTDFTTANPQIVSIRLIPPGVVLPPANSPTARFVFTKPVNLNVPALFDASGSCPRGIDGSGACLPPNNQGATITNYAWSFGDGGTGTGLNVTHAFRSLGTFTVTLTVTNDRGVSGSSSQSVTVEQTAAPTGDIIVSPTTPVVGDKVLFNASSIQAAPGHSITQYNWDFGDPNAGAGNPNNASGSSASHIYNSPGAYNVVLTVTDDTGQTKTFTKSLTVGNGQPKAVFTFAIVNVFTDTVQVDGSGSSAAGTASIVSFNWSWGDGSPSGSGQVATHSYFASGPVTITLTVTDSLGRVGTTSQTVTLP